MKKLLIAMTAAAVGTCAWATEGAGGEGTEPTTPATPTMLNETFGDNWTLNAPWSYWSGAESATPAEGELTAGDALSLNTGSKVLRGNFMSDGSAKDIDTGLYFNATVTFKDPSDTLPELKDSDKFALVVLDNVESIDAGKATTPATNLWVIAKYGEDGQRAYQLDVEVTPSWLAAEHKIVVKAYENVMASGNCAGFLVKVDNEDNDTVCTVVQSCAIVEGVIDFNSACAGNFWKDGEALNLGYLGYPKAAILGAVQKRYTDATLILSNVPGSDKLTSVDFQGQGDIDNVSLATTGEGFGTDSLALTVVPDGVTLVDTDTTLYFAEVGDKVTIKFSVNEGFELSSPTGLTPVDGVYTYEYTTTANNEEVTISAFEPVASVGDTKYKSVLLALTYVANNGGEIKLLKDATIADVDAGTYGLTITEGANVVIDLNGKTIQAGANAEEGTYASTIAVYGGSLTIKDTSELKTGKVLISEAAVEQGCFAIDATAGLTTIEAGQIGLIGNGTADTLKLVGGTYTDVGETFYLTAEQMKYDGTQYEATVAGGIWTVAEKQIVNYTVTATYNADQVTVTDLTTGAVAENTVLEFEVAAKPGFENIVVMAGDTVLTGTNGAYTWTVVADVTITITAQAVVVGPSIDDEEGEITVDNSGNATIDTTNATVTVTGTITGDVIVTPSVSKVNVTLAAGKEVKIYSGNTDITGAFTVVTDGGTTTIELNPDGKVGDVFVRPEMAAASDDEGTMQAPFEVGTDVAVGVKTIPGLKYRLKRGTELGTYGHTADEADGTGDPVKLSDDKKPAGKAFYIIEVTR